MRILSIAAVAALMLPVAPVAAAPAAAPAAPAAAPAAHAQVRVTIGNRHHRNHRRAYWRNECRTKWVRHHRQRVCHRVRAWR